MTGQDQDDEARRFFWRGAIFSHSTRALLATPWHRGKATSQAVLRRLRQPAGADAPPLVTTALGLCALTLILIGLLFLPIDGRISAAMTSEPPGVVAFLRLATDVGLVRWYVYPTAALIALLSTMDWSAASRIDRVVVANVYGHTAYLAASVALAGIVTQIGKRLFGRARPELVDSHGSLGFETLQISREFASFPSGHATTMGAVTLVLCVWFPTLRAPLLAMGIAFALTRVVVREHYPSDVAVGFAIGATVAVLIARYLARRRLLYACAAGGRGLRGLIPIRSDRTRDLDRRARSNLRPRRWRAGRGR